ncbi:MAG: inorganic phosphate transporter [Bacteroidota bacterium]|nr:inorganic phosphate transporter [Bacteroidota bacterium]
MTLLIIIIVLALIFDYINGFHDAANSIATVVSTKVLTPFQAVIWAALFNFLAFFIFKDHGVANTVAKTVHKEFVTLPVIISGLIGAITWNLITWWKGIPSSSSHTLIGGFAGAAIAHGGFGSIEQSLILKTASFIILAPLIGMIVAFIISIWFLNSFRKSIYPKLFSLLVITLVSWFVFSKLEFKKDFRGGSAYTLVFDKKTVKDDLKKTLTFVDENEKEYSPVLKAAKDSPGNPDKTGTVYILKTAYLKKANETEENVKLTSAILAKIEKAGLHANIRETHRINEASPERFDESNLKTSFESYWLKVMFHGSNFKWILLGFILIVIAVFTLFMSSLNNARSTSWFKRLQLVSSAAFSIGHGGNDAQKVMGIITAALIAGGSISSFEEMPTWVPLACYTVIGLGTLSGGWKIVKTMGTKITKVTPFEGVAAETAGAVTLFLAEGLKIPVSTTHTIAGSIMGVGATKRLSAVRWGVTINLLWAWILTIPVTGILSALIYYVFMFFYKP